MGRSIARVVALLILAATGVIGIYNGFDEWANRYTLFQRAVYGGVVLYGVLGLAGVYGVLRRRHWSEPVVVAWGVAITLVSSTAALAYAGDEATIVGSIAAFGGGALVAAFVIWAVRSPARDVSQITHDAT
jgi:hypothetical protein